MADTEPGSFLNDASAARLRERLDQVDRRTIAVAEDEARVAQEKATLDTVTGALDSTAIEIDQLIAAAEQAKAASAGPDKVQSVRRLIELMGAQLGVPIEGIPQPKGIAPVPGGEALIRSGLNRFDTLFGADDARPAAQSKQVKTQPMSEKSKFEETLSKLPDDQFGKAVEIVRAERQRRGQEDAAAKLSRMTDRQFEAAARQMFNQAEKGKS